MYIFQQKCHRKSDGISGISIGLNDGYKLQCPDDEAAADDEAGDY